MPRRSGDGGVKPFEFRTGIGGLPTLGGMFRSGDPATIPPHKFHLLVNMRRTPGGTITRPGLALEFDTELQECINGLTEDAGEQGGAMLVYPGAAAGFAQDVTFRAVFPDSSASYSEFAFALYGPAAAVRGDQSPVVNYPGGITAVLTTKSRPFIFRGQAVMFAEVDRNGTQAMALIGLSLPGRSFLQASDCWLNIDGPVGDPLCPGPAGQPTPANPNDPPLWPFQHPVGSANVLVYFDNPFTTGSWEIDNDAPPDGLIDSVLAIAERSDDALTGEAGVSEVLYFVAVDTAGPVRRRLVRWDGAIQTTEFSSIPDDTQVALGGQTYGPILARAGAAASADDWAAYRTESGAWSVIGGYGWTLGASPNYWAGAGPSHNQRLLEWGGQAHLIVQGTYDGPLPGTGDAGSRIQLQPQGATDFLDAPSCTLLLDTTFVAATVFSVLDAVIVGSICYAIGIYSPGPAWFLLAGDMITGAQIVPNPAFLVGDYLLGAEAFWIAAVGGRVYVASDAIGPTSGTFIHDVTDPLNPVLVYGVTATQDPTATVGRGAIGPPSDDAGGEGFQAS